MSILCGTDFSEQSALALAAAAQLAQRMQLPLHLLHSVTSRATERSGNAQLDSTHDAERCLAREADRLRELGLGTRIDVHVRVGPPDETLLALAREIDAQLIVVGALGERVPGRWQIGSHADRLAQSTHAPVLVVRDAEPFRAWVAQDRPLRVMLGADLSRSSDAAMSFIRNLQRFGPCDVTAMHLYWPPQQFARLGIGGTRNYLDPHLEVTSTIVRELEQRLCTEQGSPGLCVRVEPHLGRPGDRLAELAARSRADVVVVGTHDRAALGRLWEGSVSRGVLHCASTSVACVPLAASDASAVAPRMQAVLIATDFSKAGNAAVPLAYSVLEPNGTLHLVHVVPPMAAQQGLDTYDIFQSQATHPDARHAAVVEQLRHLIPARATHQNTVCHVLESHDPALAICQAAERLGVDVLCLGTRGRSGLVKALLGSVSQAVVAHSERPVLLVHMPRD